MPSPSVFIVTALLFFSMASYAQDTDSTLMALQQIPTKYITAIDKKITTYSSRITGKTEKTLVKLSRWESKIKGLLEKADPATASRLFAPGQPTFASLLQQVKQGEALAMQYKAPYDKYNDDIATGFKYLAQQKGQLDSGLVKKAKAAARKMQELSKEEDRSEAVQQFIKERKKQLLEQAYKQIGSSRYFTKMNKEAFYYTETLKNYKAIFSDGKKAEETAKGILNKVPAFKRFMQQNSQLTTMFGQPGSAANMPNLAGLQTRASVQNLIAGSIASGGPNAEQEIRENIQHAQGELNKLKDKLMNAPFGEGNGGGTMPDFKPDMQKTKTFKQRLEYGTNMQFSRSNSLMPSVADMGLSIGYKLNDKSVIGLGGSYKLGMGTLSRIRFSGQGASIRSFTDWKLKKQFFVSGGFEMNYLSDPRTQFLQPVQAWQQSGLIGLSKKISMKTKLFKQTKVQLLYDFLSQQHLPVSQPVVFRVGYGF